MGTLSRSLRFPIRLIFPALFCLLVLPVGIFYLLNGVFNIIRQIMTPILQEGLLAGATIPPLSPSLFLEVSLPSSTVLIGLMAFSLLIGLVVFGKVWLNFRDLRKNQKGSARFTSFDEMKQQYRRVPDRKKRYDGLGGVPVGRVKNELFIDDSPVNNLVIGTTRSGKGETFVFSTIDLYSRARDQASLIINDPKGELFAASKETLEQRGYQVEVLNLMNPLQSMSYNLLQLTIDAFLEENYSLAQQYARSVAFMLYHDPKARDPFWANSSIDLCTALILGLCEESKDTPEKINMYNVALMLSDLGSRTVVTRQGQEISALDEFFQRFPENHPARLQFATLHFSGGQTRASILANTNAKLGIFTLNGTGKLTSMNSLDMRRIGFNRWISGRTEPLTRTMFKFPDGTTHALTTDDDGSFIVYHTSSLQSGNTVQISTDSSTATIQLEAHDEESGRFHYAIDGTIQIREVMHQLQPVAVFLIVPDYDPTFNVIASLYIKQVYTALARVASQTIQGKCERQVVFLLDEFGNMPPIEGMANIITVCLGRNMRFNLVIQAYSQLENLYGEDWKTIDGNCGNTHYLLTADESTAELISKKLGEATIVTKSRSGQTFSLKKSKTENVDGRRLMTATEVMGLKEGEMLIIRVIKRQDTKKRRIQSYPIFLSGKTAMKYRYEYLADDFDTDRSLHDIDIPCRHAGLDFEQIRVRFAKKEDETESNAPVNQEDKSLTVRDVLQDSILRSMFEGHDIGGMSLPEFETNLNLGLYDVTDSQKSFLSTMIAKRLEKLKQGTP